MKPTERGWRRGQLRRPTRRVPRELGAKLRPTSQKGRSTAVGFRVAGRGANFKQDSWEHGGTIQHFHFMGQRTGADSVGGTGATYFREERKRGQRRGMFRATNAWEQRHRGMGEKNAHRTEHKNTKARGEGTGSAAAWPGFIGLGKFGKRSASGARGFSSWKGG